MGFGPTRRAKGVSQAFGAKADSTRRIEAVGAELRYLPPYPPDLNPIEQVFAKLKALLRKAACRTIDDLWAVIGQLINHFEPGECANTSEIPAMYARLESALARQFGCALKHGFEHLGS